MTDITKTDTKFASDIAGAFHQILKAAGVSMSPIDAHDRIRKIATTLALSIEHRGEVKAIEVIKILQVAIKTAFESMEKDMEDLRARLIRLENASSSALLDKIRSI